MSGLTPEGFVPKRTPEIKLEREQGLLDRFGSVNLNPSAVFGQFVGLTTERESDLWARLEDVYWSQYPSSAAGITLDRVVSLNGIERLAARPTFVRGVVSGTVGTILTIGRLVSSSITGEQYSLLVDTTIEAVASVGARVSVATVANSTNYTINLGGVAYTINSGAGATAGSILTMLMGVMPVGVTSALTVGTGATYLDLSYDTAQDVTLSANLGLSRVSNFAEFAGTKAGPITAPAHSLDQIVTPVAGWSVVDNRTSGTDGRDLETDAELRVRRLNSLRLTGSGTLEAIISHLQQVPGVLALRVVANNGTVTDAEGIPPQHIRAIVEGGVNEQIARVLFTHVAAGIGYHGATTVNVVSLVSNTTYPVKFDRPTNVRFYVTMTIKKSATTSTNVIELVRNALVAYAETLNIAEPVFYTQLFTPINAVIGDGAYVQSMYIATTPPTNQVANLTPTAVQRMTLDDLDIQVFVV